MSRPRQLVAVVGTGTEVGKTWVGVRILCQLRSAGFGVAARKPVQSFEPGTDPALTDAGVLAEASGEHPYDVCRSRRWFEVGMAPPMAAERLGRPGFSIAELVAELDWSSPASPTSTARVDVGLVEAAGGVRSPMAADGDCVDLVGAVAPDLVVLVSDAGLGTLNGVRLSLAALGVTTQAPIVVVLNRFDADNELHRLNRRWLVGHDGFDVVTSPDEVAARLLRKLGDPVQGEPDGSRRAPGTVPSSPPD